MIEYPHEISVFQKQENELCFSYYLPFKSINLSTMACIHFKRNGLNLLPTCLYSVYSKVIILLMKRFYDSYLPFTLCSYAISYKEHSRITSPLPLPQIWC